LSAFLLSHPPYELWCLILNWRLQPRRQSSGQAVLLYAGLMDDPEHGEAFPGEGKLAAHETAETEHLRVPAGVTIEDVVAMMSSVQAEGELSFQESILAAVNELSSASPEVLMKLRRNFAMTVQAKGPSEAAAQVERETGMRAVAQLMQTPLGVALIAAIVAALLMVGSSLATAYLENLLHLIAPPVVIKVEQPHP
jgi:hypothetical protein